MTVVILIIQRSRVGLQGFITDGYDVTLGGLLNSIYFLTSECLVFWLKTTAIRKGGIRKHN